MNVAMSSASGFVLPVRSAHRHHASTCARPAHRLKLTNATSGDDPFDIDDLARRLSSEAASRLSRSSQDEGDLADEGPGLSPSGTSAVLGPFGNEDPAAIAAELGAIGVPSLLAANFVIFRELGTLQVQQMAVGDLPGSLNDEAPKEMPSVVAYAATYETGRPFQGGVTVLLKEFLPGSTRAGLTELQILNTMQALPEVEGAWQAANRDMEDNGIVAALGWFRSPPSQEVPGFQEGSPKSLWVVYKYENMKPLVAYPTARQPPPAGGVLMWGGGAAERSPRKLRHKMLRAMIRGALRAVQRCHQKGVTHGSLGSGSIMVNTFDDASAAELVVKLDNFGFAQRIAGGAGVGAGNSALAYGMKADRCALAAALCEIVFCSLSLQPNTTANMQRLMSGVYADDFAGFRAYAETVEEWSDAVEFLSGVDAGGWDLLEHLIQADDDLENLLESPFLDV